MSGKVRFMYSRRKVVWDLIAKLVRSGNSAQVACDKIYTVYGHGTSVTKIINQLSKDNKSNTIHPILQVSNL